MAAATTTQGPPGSCCCRSSTPGQNLRDGMLVVLFVLLAGQAVVAAGSPQRLALLGGSDPSEGELRPFAGAGLMLAGIALVAAAQLPPRRIMADRNRGRREAEELVTRRALPVLPQPHLPGAAGRHRGLHADAPDRAFAGVAGGHLFRHPPADRRRGGTLSAARLRRRRFAIMPAGSAGFMPGLGKLR